jgi:hypothetical protein
VCATSDGGRHWYGVFRLPAQTGITFGLLRWSRTSGLVALQTGNGRGQRSVYWTVDGGRRWFRLSAVPLPVACTDLWSGRIEFCEFDVRFRRSHEPIVTLSTAIGCGYECSTSGEIAVHRAYRVDGWPPTEAARCHGRWRTFAGAVGPWTWATRHGNICLDQGHDVGMRVHFLRETTTTD